MFKQFYRGVSLCSLIILSACGGGGSESRNDNSSVQQIFIASPNFNWLNSWANFMKQNASLNYSISGNLNNLNVTGTGVLSIAYQDSLLTYKMVRSNFSFTEDNVVKVVENLTKSQIEFKSIVTTSSGTKITYDRENWYQKDNLTYVIQNPASAIRGIGFYLGDLLNKHKLPTK